MKTELLLSMELNIETELQRFHHLCYNYSIETNLNVKCTSCMNQVLIEFSALLDNIDSITSICIQETSKKALLNEILYTRSIACGLGCGPLVYKMMEIYLYHSFHKMQHMYTTADIIELLQLFVKHTKTSIHHGSWKDVFLFIETLYYSKRLNKQYSQAFINAILEIIVFPQMQQDEINMKNNICISFCGKWLPRECGSKKWLAKWIAVKYYKFMYNMIPTNNKVCYKHYRQLCSAINLYLYTPQVFMASRQWDNIVFDRVSQRTLQKYKHSFLNTKNINESHRYICSMNCSNYMNQKMIFC